MEGVKYYQEVLTVQDILKSISGCMIIDKNANQKKQGYEKLDDVEKYINPVNRAGNNTLDIE